MNLNNGWRVLERIEKPPTATGGHFSVCYLAQSETGARGFLKALDFSKALEAPDPARALQAMTEAYNFERDILAKCRDRNMDRVVRAIEDGSIRIEGAPAGGVVQYLIFEPADRDVRLHLAFAGRVDVAWKLRSLHHVATGLMQLHSAGIAHQDVKPSNVLVFDQRTSKVGDLGRAAYDGHAGPWDDLPCAGDRSYAPPELLYGYLDADWRRRRFGCDLYLLGSMAVFFFTGLSATGLLTGHLPEPFRCQSWGGSFDEVLPYLRDSFGRVLNSFAGQIPDDRFKDELRIIVSQLCDPDPRQRGVPVAQRGIAPPFSLERYVSKFNLLAGRAEMRLIKG